MYRQSDVEVVYRRGDWHIWSDIVSWFERGLSRDQQADNELSEAESHRMLDAFRRLDEQGRPFTRDPAEAYEALESVS